ncbi:MAG TPA: ABC transporter substrate binding protein [Terriglobales bacterium]|nr:ABC transporter substrate binding protein [Terriglobales bacterium]
MNLLAIKRRQRVLDHQGHWNGADRHTAFFVDKILKGANPADLPNARASKFQFVVNLKTAQALGLDVPTATLLRADEGHPVGVQAFAAAQIENHREDRCGSNADVTLLNFDVRFTPDCVAKLSLRRCRISTLASRSPSLVRTQENHGEYRK